jgi:preprotein translocase subunit SecG
MSVLVGDAFSFVAEVSAQNLPQLQPSPEQPHLDIPFAYSQNFRHFFRGQPFNIPQQENGAVTFGQLLDGFVQNTAEFVLFGYFCRVAPFSDKFWVWQGFPVFFVPFSNQLFQRNGFAPATPPENPEGVVHGYAVEPCPESGFTAKVAQMLQCAQKRVLQDIFSIFSVAGDTQSQIVKPLFVWLYELCESVIVALLRSLQKVSLIHRALSPCFVPTGVVNFVMPTSSLKSLLRAVSCGDDLIEGVTQMSVLGYLAAALNLIFAIGLILAMVLHITEQETSGGGGWGIVGGRHILSSQSGMATFIDRVIAWIAAGWLITAFLVALIFRPS